MIDQILRAIYKHAFADGMQHCVAILEGCKSDKDEYLEKFLQSESVQIYMKALK